MQSIGGCIVSSLLIRVIDPSGRGCPGPIRGVPERTIRSPKPALLLNLDDDSVLHAEYSNPYCFSG